MYTTERMELCGMEGVPGHGPERHPTRNTHHTCSPPRDGMFHVKHPAAATWVHLKTRAPPHVVDAPGNRTKPHTRTHARPPPLGTT